MNAKPERNRLRRKLQKINPRDASTNSSRATTPDVKTAPATPALNSIVPPQITKCEPILSTTCEVNNAPKDQHVYRGRTVSEPKVPLRVRRLGSLRRHQDLADITESPSERSDSPASLIPELAHLSNGSRSSVISTTKPGEATRLPSHRPNLSTSSVPIRERRYAKTPVRSIEQLENASVRDPITASKVSSVDLIAESYRVLIESDRSLLATPKPSMLPLRRMSESTLEDVRETVLVAAADEDSYDDSSEPTTPRARHYTRGTRRSPRQADSPLSDTGTLVGPEELAIYFKPSFSPGSTPVVHDFVLHDEPPAPSPALSMDTNPGLSICLDLLSRELQSAAAGSPMRPGSETSALQIQAMIEAYENLRDQAAHLGLDSEQALAAHDMFDTWLQALRAVQAKISVRELPARAYERRRPGAVELE